MNEYQLVGLGSIEISWYQKLLVFYMVNFYSNEAMYQKKVLQDNYNTILW